MNIIASDLNQMEQKFPFLFFIIAAPIQVSCYIYILYSRFGAFGLISIVTLTTAYPLQYFLAWMTTKKYVERNKLSDERIKKTNEVVEGIRLIKLYGYEDAFAKVINRIRNNEVVQILWI